MTIAKFAAGDRVKVQTSAFFPSLRPGVYEVTRVLPVSSTGRQYRAKNIADAFECVFGESEMTRV